MTAHPDFAYRLPTEMAGSIRMSDFRESQKDLGCREMKARLLKGEWLELCVMQIDNYERIFAVFGRSEAEAIVGELVERLHQLHRIRSVYQIGPGRLMFVNPCHSLDDIFLRLIIASMRQPVILEGRTHMPQIALAIVTATSVKQDPALLVQNALFNLHDRGKSVDPIIRQTSIELREAVNDLELSHALRVAIEGNDLQVVFQPIVSSDGTIRSLEALCRWTHAKHGPQSPERFIRIAENENLICDLGRQVRHKALRDFGRWRAQTASSAHLSLNVTPVELRDNGFRRELIEACSEWLVPTQAVTLEITERTLLVIDEGDATLLGHLKDDGFRIAIDDFGTGHAGFEYLKDFSFDALKIDKGFVQNIETSPTCRAIVHSLLDLSNSLEMTAVCEGVENEWQLEFLRQDGADLFQGHLFSKPVSVEDLFRQGVKLPRRRNRRMEHASLSQI